MAARVLVTGISGFVGSHLTRRLTERGDAALGTGIEAVEPETPGGLAGYWSADVRDADRLRAVLREARPDAIVHLAAQSSGAASFEHPVETFETNALGTLTLLEAVKQEVPRARVLVVGTGDVYGPQPQGSRVTEDAPFQPLSPYTLSKAAADGIAETCGRLWDLDIVRTRSFGHAGPGQTTRFLVASWCSQIAAIERGSEPGVLRVGNLDITRDFTDVRDVVEAYLVLIERGRPGAAYNVCRGEGTRLDALADSLCRRARRPIRIEIDPARVRAADIPYLVGDPTAIHEATGWRPTIPLERTLDETLSEWRVRVVRNG